MMTETDDLIVDLADLKDQLTRAEDMINRARLRLELLNHSLERCSVKAPTTENTTKGAPKHSDPTSLSNASFDF
jgi:multidrug resistance efflux pump